MEQPALDGASTLEAARNLQSRIPDGPYVLVVDDQQVVRDFLKRSLESSGFAVKQAGSALIALELMATAAASVVLCDVRMPVNNGLWLTEQLRARWPDVPVIMITALEDEETISACRGLGAFDYLTKPISQKQLRDAVRRAMATLEEMPVAADAAPSASTDLQTALDKIDAEYSLRMSRALPRLRRYRLLAQGGPTAARARQLHVDAAPPRPAGCLSQLPGDCSRRAEQLLGRP